MCTKEMNNFYTKCNINYSKSISNSLCVFAILWLLSTFISTFFSHHTYTYLMSYMCVHMMYLYIMYIHLDGIEFLLVEIFYPTLTFAASLSDTQKFTLFFAVFFLLFLLIPGTLDFIVNERTCSLFNIIICILYSIDWLNVDWKKCSHGMGKRAYSELNTGCIPMNVLC